MMQHGSGQNASKEYVLGLDVGTSSGKVCAIGMNGAFLGVEAEAYPTIVPQPAWAEQKPDLWLPALGHACRRLLRRLGLAPLQARGLAITSAAHIGVLLDEHREVLRPALLWQDQRSQAEAEELSDIAGAEIFGIGNNWPTPTWTLPHLLWVRRAEPELWRRVRHILLSKDYVGFRLTGRMVSDPAAAVSALLLDAKNNAWSERLCALAGISTAMLPEILPIGAKIGPLSAEGAETLGLTTRTVLFNGTVDSTAETFSAGVRREGECVIRLASAGGIHGISDPPRVHPKLISYPYPIAPFWLSQAGTNTCASAVSWAYRLLNDEPGREPDYHAWDGLAETSPAGAKGLLFHPYLAGERCPCWDSNLRASFTGLGLHHGRGDLARAVYEGTAYSLRDAMSVLAQQGFSLTHAKLVGGGARSRLWSQTVANILDCPAQAAPEADSSAGAALFSLVGLGVFGSLSEVPADLLSGDAGPLSLPDRALTAFHDETFARYLDVQKHLAEMSHRNIAPVQ